MKYFKISEYLYVFLAFFFLYIGISEWNSDPSRAYLSLFFMILAVGMYFFRRHYRQKIDQRNSQK